MKLLPALFLLLASATFAAEKPNILLIMADDVGSDAIGAYGGMSYPTPHIDALSAGGATFHNGFAMPVCHPSRISLMTGKYPVRFGAEGSKWGDYPEAAEGASIGDVMKSAGYATAVAGKWQLCLMKNDPMQPARTGFDEWLLFGWHEGARYHDPYLYRNGELQNDTSGRFGPDLYVEFLVDFMQRSHDAGTPFFAYYPMALCHDVTDDLKGELVPFFRDGRWMNYAEMMGAMDDMVGRLISTLEKMGIREDTLVIFTTDNGTAARSYLTVDENGKMFKSPVYSIRDGEVVPGGKGRFDDTGTRVPFIANWPGSIAPKSDINELVDLTDLLPTLAEIGDAPDDGIDRDGISFAPLLFGKPRAEERPWVFLQVRDNCAIRSATAKLYPNGKFYDLNEDPGEISDYEKVDLFDEQLAAYEKLWEVLSELDPKKSR